MRAGLGPIGIGTLIAAVLADRVTVATPLAVFTGKAVCRARAPLAVDDNIRPSPFLAFYRVNFDEPLRHLSARDVRCTHRDARRSSVIASPALVAPPIT